VFVGEFFGQDPQRETRVGAGPGGHDRQSQGQPGAVVDQVGDRVGFGVESVWAEVAGQQRSGLLWGQHV
jgi:hypothetical protein